MANLKVVIIAEEKSVDSGVKEILSEIGYTDTDFLQPGRNILTELQSTEPDVVLLILDSKQKKKKIDAARTIRENNNIPVIFLISETHQKLIPFPEFEQQFDVIIKTSDANELRTNLERFLSRYELDRYLKQHAEWLSLFFEKTEEAVILMDKTFSVNFMNPAAEAFTGWYNREASGKLIDNILNTSPKNQAQKLFSQLKQCFENPKKTVEIGRTVLTNKKGKKIDVQLHVSAIVAQEASPVGSVLALREISGRDKFEQSLWESEEKFKSLAEHSPNMIFINKKGRIIYANEMCEIILGYSRNEFYADSFNFLQLIAPEDKKMVQENYKVHLKGKDIPPYEYGLVAKNGKKIDVIISTKLIEYEGEKAILGIVTDISDRKRTEEIFRTQTRYRENVIQTASVLIVTLDENANIMEFNNHACELTGYTKEEVVGKNWFETFIPEKQRNGIKNIFKDVYYGERLHWGNENEILCKNGERKIISWHNSLLKDEEGHTSAVLAIGNDITSRKQSEKDIKRRLEFEQTIARLSSRFVGVFNMDEAINQSLEELGRISGASRVYLFFLRDNGAKMDNTHEWCAEGVSPQMENLKDIPSNMFPWWMKKLQDNQLIRIRDVAQLPDDAQSEKEILESQLIKSLLVIPVRVKSILVGFIGFDNVIHAGDWKDEDSLLLNIFSELLGYAFERKHAEEESEALSNRNQALLEALPDDIFVLSRDGKFLDTTTDKEIHSFGVDALIGKNIKDIGLSGTHVKLILHGIEKALKSGEVQTIEYELETKIGLGYYEARIVRLSENEVIANVRNITERKRLENELIKAEKLESLGVMAGGIAHDFNNLMTAIVGNISLGKLYEGNWEKILDRLEAAENASFRAKDLTQQLLTFARGGEPIKKTISIKKLVKESVKFTLSGSKLSCQYHFDKDLSPVEVDESQIHQVIHNLVINAVQAMPRGGQLEVLCENVNRQQDQRLPEHHDKYVKISVKDFGTGILQEHLPKIFDPYFTTKQQGSGLGLASAFSIIRKHDGHIEVESEIGKGATFHIFLPASFKEVDAEKNKDRDLWRGSGKVLLMDDEEIVREIASSLLIDLGFQVEEAQNGEEAIELYQQALNTETPFTLVIMDLTVAGGMGGKEAISELRKIDPNVRAVVSSGYSIDDVMADYKSYGFRGVIKKPFTVQEFSEVLKHILTDPEAD